MTCLDGWTSAFINQKWNLKPRFWGFEFHQLSSSWALYSCIIIHFRNLNVMAFPMKYGSKIQSSKENDQKKESILWLCWKQHICVHGSICLFGTEYCICNPLLLSIPHANLMMMVMMTLSGFLLTSGSSSSMEDVSSLYLIKGMT